MMMHQPAKMQKLFKASIDVVEPKKNAMALVNEVIVIDGPAERIPISIRSWYDRVSGVRSIALAITNMSSTPIPIKRKGIRE